MENEEKVENKIFGRTFFWMFLGLLGSGIIAWYTYSSGLIFNIITEGTYTIILILELIVALVFSLLFKKLPPTAVGILYFIYSMINGVTLATVFAIFQLSSIINLFIISALIFGVFALIGYKTNKDLNSWGTYITIFLIAGIIISLINLFIGNTLIDTIVDWAMLILFCGITIYDINKIKFLQQSSELNQDKIHIYCAMQLYLDFINIFIRMLSIFGKRKD